MANKMKVSEIQAQVKDTMVEKLGLVHNGDDIIQYGNYDYAVPVEVDGVVRYAKVSITCGQLEDSKSNLKFDPIAVRDEWLEDKAFKEEQERLKAELKAKKKK